MSVSCDACRAAVEPENFCTNCGAKLHHWVDVAVPRNSPAPALTQDTPAKSGASPASTDLKASSAPQTPGMASRVWDGLERVGNAVTSVFAVFVGLCWVAIGIALFVATANGYGNGWSWLVGIGVIIYGIFLIMPTRGTRIIIY